MTTGQLIREARKKAGMTQIELAQKLGIPFQSVSQWERDLRNPKHETLKRIAKALNVHILSLIDWDAIPAALPDAEVPSLEEIEEMERRELRPRLLSYYDELNFEGQQKAVERLAELTEIPRYRAETTPQSSIDSTDGKDTTTPQDGPERPQEGG